MRSIEVECFGKLSMVMHSAGRDLDVVLDERCLCSWVRVPPDEVMPKCSATMDSAGVHVMGGRLTSARGVSGSSVKANRVKPDTFIVAAVSFPGKMQKIGINDLHVALSHSNEVTL